MNRDGPAGGRMKLSDFKEGDHVLLSGEGERFPDLAPRVFTVTERREDSPYTSALVTLARRSLGERRAVKRFLSERDLDPACVTRVSPWLDLAARLPETVRVTSSVLEVAALGAAHFRAVATLDADGHAVWGEMGEAWAASCLRAWLRASGWSFASGDDAARLWVEVAGCLPRPAYREDLCVRVENAAASGERALATGRAIREALEQVQAVDDRRARWKAQEAQEAATRKRERAAKRKGALS